MADCRFVVVGAGLFGLTIAERIAAVKKEQVLLIEKRDHLGGNAAACTDAETGIEVHRYGSHIFHTHHENVWKYLGQFCKFTAYRHRVLSFYRNNYYPIPINLETINRFFNREFSSEEAAQFISRRRLALENPANLEDKALSMLGKDLYEAFFQGYTQKQWALSPRLLPPEIVSRIPLRFDFTWNYFDDHWQGLPENGYDELFRNMAHDRRIKVTLNTDYFRIRDKLPSDHILIFTGPIDSFFDYRYGRLNYRSLWFQQEVHPCSQFQPAAVVNYPEMDVAYTRIHEFRHYYPERKYPDRLTVISREYPQESTFSSEPMYPVNTEQDKRIHAQYRRLADKKRNFFPGGRLGLYEYLDMDDTVQKALRLFEEKLVQL
ncbi:MAG: UDP-galactopyranose mutase [Candidatus Cloacimonetes bacterium]|nr:UDP-galactopyranose mutase [Candidatus Cloacimonadota bacterium]